MAHLFIKLCCSKCGKDFDVPVYCGDRFCSVCSVRRNNRVRKRLTHLIDNCSKPKHHGLKFLTLTIKNQTNLSGMVAEIVASFRKLRNRKFWKDRCDGGAYVLEITGGTGDWHAHLHIVMMADWMWFETLLHIWMKVSSGRGVYIKEIPKRQAVGYLAKYLTKPNVSDSDLDAVNEELKGKRLFSPFGSWHSISKEFKFPPAKCRDCSNEGFVPWDLQYGLAPQPFYRDCDLSPPGTHKN